MLIIARFQLQLRKTLVCMTRQNFSNMTLLFSRDSLQRELLQERKYRVIAEQSVLI